MTKRTTAFVLAVLMLVIILPATASAGSLSNFTVVQAYEAGQFTDVADQWFAPYVKAAYEYGLINGTSQTTFSPEKNLTLAEAVKLAACLHSVYNTGTASFPSGDPWYQPYIDYAVQNGILGTPFADYTVPATRADFAMMFANALPDEALSVINKIDANSIPDVKPGYSYGPAVYKLYKAGILTGSDSAGTFFPNSSITRDAVAAIVTRMANAAYRQTLSLTLSALSATEISEMCAPAVFYVDLRSKAGTTIGSGSGFFISSDGLAVTNYHVVENMIDAKAKTKDGTVYDIVGVIDYNKETDLALIKVSGASLPFLTLGDSDSAVTGASVYTIGYPLGVDQTVAPGAITNASHPEDGVNYIMISAPVSPGSSGGALVDSSGNVIGVTNASYSDGQNLNLAVPINLLGDLSRTKEPVSLSELFARDYTYYTRYPSIPDFASVTGGNMRDQYYDIDLQAQIYLYDSRTKDDVYDLIDAYLDQLDIEGFEYLGYMEQDDYYFYGFTEPGKEWEIAVGIMNINNTEYAAVMVYPYTEEAAEEAE